MPAPRPAAIPAAEVVDEFARFGIRAFTTGREAGSFGTVGDEPVGTVMGRWDALRAMLASGGPRLATARQVHGARVILHREGWEGWLRAGDADGHLALERGTAMAVSVADCVPVFLAHPGGATAVLHSGWRGTEARIVEAAVAVLAQHGIPAGELLLHLGPAICGRCYEVSPDVYARLTGRSVDRPAPVDLRALIAGQARGQGVRHISTSPLCTRCDNRLLYSHRCGDAGRQLGVVQAPLP
ncbi:MAG: polyphenol oxidase family protein [Gemmatimonadaceae bacterium]